MPSGTTTSVNASEDQIKAVQEQLKTAGLYAGDVDGIIGRQTKQALQEFQQQHGLQMTLAALQSNTGQAGSTAAPSNGHAPRAGGLNRNSSGNPPQR
jgi:peptidoglycan hydrolase-like protein with peptidoglycan-binding domain